MDDVYESTTTLKVVWHAPVNTGERIDSYSVQYKKSTETSFGSANVAQTDMNTNATISDLEADTSYQVRVQATSPEGTGPWSLVGTGSTNKGENGPPKFIDTANIVKRMWMRTKMRGKTSVAQYTRRTTVCSH